MELDVMHIVSEVVVHGLYSLLYSSKVLFCCPFAGKFHISDFYDPPELVECLLCGYLTCTLDPRTDLPDIIGVSQQYLSVSAAFYRPHELEYRKTFTKRASADTQLFSKISLGGQLFSNFYLALSDRIDDRFHNQFGDFRRIILDLIELHIPLPPLQVNLSFC